MVRFFYNQIMKIYLLDNNPIITTTWSQYFTGCKDVIVINKDFDSFMKSTKVDCIVSPGNSHGIMLGGYDLAITKYFGLELTKKVQAYIKKNYHGLQPIGTAFIIDIPNSKIKLIHSPTMERPIVINDPKVVKDCMIATLQIAQQNKIKSIVIPAFGGATGKVNPNDIAKLMYDGYEQIKKDA